MIDLICDFRVKENEFCACISYCGMCLGKLHGINSWLLSDSKSLCSRSGKGNTSECKSNYLGKKETTSTRLGILAGMKGGYAYLKDANAVK